MKKEELIKDLKYIINKISNEEINNNFYKEIKDYVHNIKLILQENELEMQKINNNKPYLIKSGIYKYMKKINKCIFDKEEQAHLHKILYCLNGNKSISIVNAFKFLKINYKYMYNENYKDWKDVIIFPDYDIKEEFNCGTLIYDDVWKEWVKKLNK